MEYEDKFIYTYTATYYNTEGHEAKECGIIYAADYKDVFDQINVMYGDDLVHINIKSAQAYAPLRFEPKHLAYIITLVEEQNY